MGKSARISLSEAIEDPLLFRTAFYGTGKDGDNGFTPQQAVVIKAIYGLALSEEELYWWAALNGEGIWDELGYLTGVRAPFAYTPTEFQDITLTCGRRGAKTSISSFIVAYEALCGGHHEYLGRAKRQLPVLLQIAQDVKTARANLRTHILSYLESSPVGRASLGNLKETVTMDTIRLPFSEIVVGAPNIKLRGQSVAVAALDEVGSWPKDMESAAPDMEIERAITPAMLQFEFRKRLKTSTPMTKEGLLWRAHETGTYGHKLSYPKSRRRVLVLEAPTAFFMNPTVTRADLEDERAKDELGFKREIMAEFSDSVTGFLSAAQLRASVEKGVTIRAPRPGVLYVATIDAGFRRDAFVLSIAHLENGKYVQDVLESWRGSKEVPLSPAMVMGYVAGRCKEYSISVLVSDQYHSESLQELAEQNGIALEPCPLTNQLKKTMYSSLQLMLMQGRLVFLDHPDLVDELAKLEKTLTSSGAVQISGKRDDHAMAVALNLHRALQFGEVAAAKPDAPKATDPSALFWEFQRKKRSGGGAEVPWYR